MSPSSRSDAAVRVVGVVSFTAYAIRVAMLAWADLQRQAGASSLISAGNRALVVAMFLIMAASYLLRRPVSVRAAGFRERFFPFFCAALPMAVNESYRFAPAAESWPLSSAAFLFVGNALCVWSLFYLRRSFSIMAEVRELVSRGPYRFVRHPIYVGQAISTIGCWLWAPTWLGGGLLLLFLALQHVRASIEEAKLAAALPQYADYRKRTMAYFPK